MPGETYFPGEIRIFNVMQKSSIEESCAFFFFEFLSFFEFVEGYIKSISDIENVSLQRFFANTVFPQKHRSEKSVC